MSRLTMGHPYPSPLGKEVMPTLVKHMSNQIPESNIEGLCSGTSDNTIYCFNQDPNGR